MDVRQLIEEEMLDLFFSRMTILEKIPAIRNTFFGEGLFSSSRAPDRVSNGLKSSSLDVVPELASEVFFCFF
jgi:hypothetical protein